MRVKAEVEVEVEVEVEIERVAASGRARERMRCIQWRNGWGVVERKRDAKERLAVETVGGVKGVNRLGAVGGCVWRGGWWWLVISEPSPAREPARLDLDANQSSPGSWWARIYHSIRPGQVPCRRSLLSPVRSL